MEQTTTATFDPANYIPKFTGEVLKDAKNRIEAVTDELGVRVGEWWRELRKLNNPVENPPENYIVHEEGHMDNKRDQRVKTDAGKRRLELIPTSLYESLGDVLTSGAEKYGDWTWTRVSADRYVGALLRHLCRYMDDPDGLDDESGLPHIAHVLCNAMFLNHYVIEKRKRKEEDQKNAE